MIDGRLCRDMIEAKLPYEIIQKAVNIYQYEKDFDVKHLKSFVKDYHKVKKSIKKIEEKN